MTEAILIEISQRFRKLEDAIAEVDIVSAVLSAQRARLEAKLSKAKGTLCYDAVRLDIVNCEQQLVALTEQLSRVEYCFEQCRDDMNAMQGKIREVACVSK